MLFHHIRAQYYMDVLGYVSYLVVRQRFPQTRRRPLRALRKSFARTSVFFPSRSFPSNGLAIHSNGCSVCSFICASSRARSVSILRSSITSCLLITNCLDVCSVIQSPSSAILASSVSSDSIHSSPSRLSSRTYSRPPLSMSSLDALLGRLGLSAGGDSGMRRAETLPTLVP
jgi:hypothetical protein